MHWTFTFSLALPFCLCLPAPAQEVVSACSGTVHFFEGAVLIDDHPLEHKSAVFPAIPPGSILRTEKGRAEILLTPNVFLRIDENSAIRIEANLLSDTRIEFLRGSAILDSVDAPAAPAIVLTYQHYRIRFPKPGIYRIDSDTGVLQAYSGNAQVTSPDSRTSSIDTAKLYFFDLGTVTNKFGEPNEDEFYDWAKGRADAISAENQLAAQSNGDSSEDDGSLAPFTSPLPSYGTSPAYPYIGPSIGSYAFSGPYFDPFLGFNAGPYSPYTIYPLFLVVPRRGSWTSRWPHSNPTVNPGFVVSRPGLVSSPIRIPTYTPRPASSAVGGVRVYRPTPASAPRPAAPIAIHH